MADKIPIRDVVGTYDLTPERADKAARIAAVRIEEFGITSFDEQYRYVAGIVERFTAPRQERRALRLNSQMRDSDTTFHEIIGAEDPNFDELFDDEPPKGMSYQEVLDVLGGRLDRDDVALFSTFPFSLFMV